MLKMNYSTTKRNKDKSIDPEWEYYKNDFIKHLKENYSDLYDEIS